MLEQAVLRAVFPEPAHVTGTKSVRTKKWCIWGKSRDGDQKASGQKNGAYGANHVTIYKDNVTMHVTGTKKRPDKKMVHMGQIT